MKSCRTALILSTTLGSMIKSITVSAGNVNVNEPRLLALYDRYGQSPCALEERVKNLCPSSLSNNIPSAFLGQEVGECTCNVIFFNLWSACLVSNGNSVLPTLDQWSQTCSNNSLNINNPPFSSINTIVLPPWATLDKPNPANTTFDVGAAIMIAQVSRGIPWTTVQIITPVLSAVATVAILGCWYLYLYSTRQHDTPWFRGRPPLFRRAHKVKETPRGEAWTIDLSESLDHQHEARMGKKFGSPNDVSRNVAVGGPEHRHNPGTWKNELPNFLSFGRPAVVRNVRPGRGWRISSVDDALESPPFMAQSPKSITRGPNVANHPIPEGEGEDAELGPRADAVEEDQETDHLISPTERSENTVFLISHRPGEDFTIESSPPASRVPCSPCQASPTAVPRGTERTNVPPSPPNRSTKESPKGSSVQKSFPFLSKLKISMPGKHSRNPSNEPNPPPRTAITENGSPPSSLPFQIPELLPLVPSPSFVNSRSVGFVQEQASPYPSFHRHQRSSSSQSFREDVSFLTPRNGLVPSSQASPHLRTASLDVSETDPSMLYPGPVGVVVYSASHSPTRSRRPSA